MIEASWIFEASWILFVAASLVLIATPGQDMILVMSRSVAQGAVAGVVTAAGVSIGLVGHTILATLGLGAILRTSEWLFLVLKLMGAGYLIYLGVGLLSTRRSSLKHRLAFFLALYRPGCALVQTSSPGSIVPQVPFLLASV